MNAHYGSGQFASFRRVCLWSLSETSPIATDSEVIFMLTCHVRFLLTCHLRFGCYGINSLCAFCAATVCAQCPSPPNKPNISIIFLTVFGVNS